MRRQKMSRKASRKNFARGNGTHRKNTTAKPMRGGIRL